MLWILLGENETNWHPRNSSLTGRSWGVRDDLAEPSLHSTVATLDDGVSLQRESEWLSESLCCALSPSVLFTSAQFSDKYCQITSCNFSSATVCCFLDSCKKCVFVSKHCKPMYKSKDNWGLCFWSLSLQRLHFELCQEIPVSWPLHPVLRKSVGYHQPAGNC